MVYGDWNRNGTRDSFDRYLDYKLSHSNTTTNKTETRDTKNYFYKSDKITDNVNLHKEPPSDYDKKDLVINLIAAIIGFSAGMIFLFIMLGSRG